MMRRRLLIIVFLVGSLMPCVSQTKEEDTARVTLAEIDAQIARETKSGDVEKEGLARWQKIVILKNSSLSKELADEAEVQMEWFLKHGQWDNYYSTWQLKAPCVP